MEKLRVVLADDHALVRTGIHRMLLEFHDLELVGEADDGPSLFATLHATAPDFLLIDVSMPEFDPISAIRQIRAQYPDMKILVISAYDDNAYVEGLLRVGVNGYYLKEYSLSDLKLAIEQVLAGRRWISSSLIDTLVTAAQPAPASPGLTTRQVQILQLLREGLDNRTISARLGLSVKTVENHLTRLYRQINVQSRSEAIHLAFEHPEVLEQPRLAEPVTACAVSGKPGGADFGVLLVDDNPRYRQQLRLTIDRICPWATVWEAEDPSAALRLIQRTNMNLVLMDVILGEENGIQCVRRMKTLRPGLHIVLISAYPDREFHRLGLEAGAVAFVDKKDLDGATLRQIIDDVKV